MRVIITGGTGLIGQALATDLAHDGHEVVVVSRNPHQTQPMPKTVQFERWNGRNAEGWGVDGADAVVNLAAASLAGEGFLPARWTTERKREIQESRVKAGEAVVDAFKATRARPRVLIQASAVGYYGVHKDEEITEESPAGSDFLAETCKLWEASSAPVEALGVRRVVIRMGVVLSTQGGALPRMALPFKLFAGGPLGSGKQYLSWIHLADVVGGIRFLIDNPNASGAFNLSAPKPVTNAELGRKLGRVLGRPAFFPTPGFALKIAFGEVSTVVLDGQRAVPKRLLVLNYPFKFTDAEAALRDVYGAKV